MLVSGGSTVVGALVVGRNVGGCTVVGLAVGGGVGGVVGGGGGVGVVVLISLHGTCSQISCSHSAQYCGK